MKTLLGVLAATIRGSSRSRVRLHTDLQVPVSSATSPTRRRRVHKFSCHGVSPAHDDSTDILALSRASSRAYERKGAVMSPTWIDGRRPTICGP